MSTDGDVFTPESFMAVGGGGARPYAGAANRVGVGVGSGDAAIVGGGAGGPPYAGAVVLQSNGPVESATTNKPARVQNGHAPRV